MASSAFSMVVTVSRLREGGRKEHEAGKEGKREGERTYRSAPTAKVAMYQT
jgi:hypothetical protein